MKPIALLVLAANICLAQEVPSLSLIASKPLSRGTTLTAWTDSVAVGDSGRIAYFARSQSDIVRTDSVEAGFGTNAPHIYHMPFGGELVVGSTEFVWIRHNGPHTVASGSDKHEFGNGFSQGGLYMASDDSGRPVRNLLVCQDGRRFHMREGANGMWRRLDSTLARGGSKFVCATDTSSNQRAVMEITKTVTIDRWNGLEYGYPYVGSSRELFEQGVYMDTIYATKIDWILSGTNGHWIAYDQTKGNVRFNQGYPRVLHVDGVPAKPSSPLLVARKDSLVVVASDSLFVFLKWTDNGVRELGRFHDTSTGILSIALADSSLWVRTGTELRLYNLAWNGSGMSSVKAAHRSQNLSIVGIDGGANLSWTGTGNAEIRLVGIDGRLDAAFSMRPGETRSWHPASKGAYFARTPSGSRRILVR